MSDLAAMLPEPSDLSDDELRGVVLAVTAREGQGLTAFESTCVDEYADRFYPERPLGVTVGQVVRLDDYRKRS